MQRATKTQILGSWDCQGGIAQLPQLLSCSRTPRKPDVTQSKFGTFLDLRCQQTLHTLRDRLAHTSTQLLGAARSTSMAAKQTATLSTRLQAFINSPTGGRCVRGARSAEPPVWQGVVGTVEPARSRNWALEAACGGPGAAAQCARAPAVGGAL